MTTIQASSWPEKIIPRRLRSLAVETDGGSKAAFDGQDIRQVVYQDPAGPAEQGNEKYLKSGS
ncbi:hypothetical protein ACFLV7_12910 [Chloroflexota bacterium]